MIRLEHLRKEYPGQEAPAVADLCLTVPEGEISVLVGPSGCGKTTTMRMINRIIEPTSGRIFIDGEDVTGGNADHLRRHIGYVIQQVGLFPHMTVADNVATVPKMLGWDKARTRVRSDEMLELVGLDPGQYRDRYPKQLSGGQRQRVGVARALCADPPVMLMDEPFGAIDPITRDRLQNEFLRLQSELRKTIVFVTHDIEEAIKMGDRIAILREGSEIAQYDTPENVLAAPADDFVREFIGGRAALRRLNLAKLTASTSAPGLPSTATSRWPRPASSCWPAARRPSWSWTGTACRCAGPPRRAGLGRALATAGPRSRAPCPARLARRRAGRAAPQPGSRDRGRQRRRPLRGRRRPGHRVARSRGHAHAGRLRGGRPAAGAPSRPERAMTAPVVLEVAEPGAVPGGAAGLTDAGPRRARSRARSAAHYFGMPLALLLTCLLLYAWVSAQTLDSIEQRVLNAEVIRAALVQHVQLVAVSTAIVIAAAVPLGVLLTRGFARWISPFVVGAANIGQSVPSLGVLVVLALVWTIGFRAAVVALVLYAFLPVLRNTMVGLQQVDPFVKEAGRGQGMTRCRCWPRSSCPSRSRHPRRHPHGPGHQRRHRDHRGADQRRRPGPDHLRRHRAGPHAGAHRRRGAHRGLRGCC
jgi:glycine/betaine/L-proline transporter ATP-binding subunit